MRIDSQLNKSIEIYLKFPFILRSSAALQIRSSALRSNFSEENAQNLDSQYVSSSYRQSRTKRSISNSSKDKYINNIFETDGVSLNSVYIKICFQHIVSAYPPVYLAKSRNQGNSHP
jgi:hypothetical protein